MTTDRTLTDARLKRMTLNDINGGLRSYRPDLRYTRADAQRFAELWNAVKVDTEATLIDVEGTPVVIATGRRA
jgi:hypothetical protein